MIYTEKSPQMLHKDLDCNQRLHRILLVCIGLTIASTYSVHAQQQNLVVEDTTTTTFVINRALPNSAIVVLYSPLSSLSIDSSIELLDTSFDPARGEYIITMRPNVANRLTLQYPGFMAYDLRIPPIESGESRSYVVRPPSPFESGTLVIETTPSDATIQVQGISVGQGSVQLVLRPGTYPIRISKEGYDPLFFSAQITLNQPTVQRRSILPARQPLTVTSNIEGARVYIEDQEIGVTPVRDFMVDQGLLVVRVESAGYNPFSQTVDIRSDRNNIINADLSTQIRILPSSSVFVQNESVDIEENTLRITYDLAEERKKYNVDVVFLGPDNEPFDVSGVRGDVGKKLSAGNGRTIYWPIPDEFSMSDVKVQVEARPNNSLRWLLVGGGLGVGGGVALAILSGSDDPDPTLASEPPGRP